MYRTLCAAGLTAFIGFQVVVNVGDNTGTIPVTGITFPFVSHGGSSLITSFTMLGMLLAFRSKMPTEPNNVESLAESGPTLPRRY